MKEILNDIEFLHKDAQRQPEVPVFIIETDDDTTYMPEEPTEVPSMRKVWLHRILKAAAIIILFVFVLAAVRLWKYYYDIGVPVSTSPAENVEKLKQPVTKEMAEVVLTSDSILGVALDLYAIRGLKACIEFTEPDTADTSVYLYSRSADHSSNNSYLGSLVVNGEEKQEDRSRLGYMAMVGDKMVIGVSRREKVKDYCVENGGSFFRQFVLVSDGVLPPRFYLHGKVERRAIGRIGESLYYIASRNKETMWDFADALREYGFIDVIYITGGKDYSFYRTADGVRHDIGSVENYPHKKWKGIIPWLVFKRIE